MDKSKKRKTRPIVAWAKKINWGRRVKAICKPCWEIKYCPYGSLVEQSPLQPNRHEHSCRIFGHDCPVFYVAEPLTETKELRNISRKIPRATQFRVLKRENQICSSCSKSVKDEDVEFDHIIPWSKGGSSDENNVRLLCKPCNRKKGKKFEDERLVRDVGEHILRPPTVGPDMVRLLIDWVMLSLRIGKEKHRDATPSDFCKYYGRREVQHLDAAATEIVKDIDALLSSERPYEIKQKTYDALKYRWGLADGEIHKLKESGTKWKVDVHMLLSAELLLINRLGWQVKLTQTTEKRWLSL